MTPQAHQTAPPAPAPTVATPAPAPSPPTAVPGSSLEASSAPRSDKAGESAQPKDARSESGQGRFAVQVGAMAQQANALALLKRLEEAGYTSTIRKSGRATTQHVVLVVTPSGRAEADAALERLRAEGIPVRVSDSDGGYRIDAGRSIALDDAIDLARQLQERGFATKIDSETVGNALYLVRVGDFLSLAEARRTGQELREKGFPVLIVKK
ncbi:MAG: SPOR domain-containing protein [Candidatus Methylomirabilaceae bacterium]